MMHGPINIKWECNVDGTIPTGDNKSYQRKICPTAIFSTRNLYQDIAVPNMDLKYESPATDRRGQNTVKA